MVMERGAMASDSFDEQLLVLVNRILDQGVRQVGGRNGDTLSLFSPPKIVLDLDAEQTETTTKVRFPLLELRKVPARGPIVEQLWIMKGKTDVHWLNKHGVRYWDAWANEDGQLGPVYGHQLRCFDGGTDQLLQVIEGLTESPASRRHCITLWNPKQLGEMALPPCHGVFMQFHVRQTVAGPVLDMMMLQRSCDVLIGLPMNVCQYTLFLAVIAEATHMKPGRLIVQLNDAHIYLNQHWHAQYLRSWGRNQTVEWWNRRGQVYLELPRNPSVHRAIQWVDGLCPDDFVVHDYDPSEHTPPLNIPVSV